MRKKDREEDVESKICNQLYLSVFKNLIFVLEFIFLIDKYMKTAEIFEIDIFLFHFTTFFFGFLNYLHSLIMYDLSSEIDTKTLLEYRLISITYFESYFSIFLFLGTSGSNRGNSGMIYIAIILDIILNILILKKTSNFEIEDNYSKQNQPRNDVLNLYSSQGMLIYIIFQILIILFQINSEFQFKSISHIKYLQHSG